MRSLKTTVFFSLLVFLYVPAAHAHPMGNFSINHYSRIEVHANTISIRYIIDMAEIPSVSELAVMDTDGDGRVSPSERAVYLAKAAPRLRDGVTLRLNGKPVALSVKPIGVQFVDGAGDLVTTRITLDLNAASTGPRFDNGEIVDYRDSNYDARTGWKEIVAVAGSGIHLDNSTVAAADRSRQLTAYPTDATVAPSQQTEAHFVIRYTGSGAPGSTQTAIGMKPDRQQPPPGSPSATANAGNTPRDAFTQAIARGNLTTGLVLLSLLIAFGFGALHALSPGHGKAMMAAYLIGARGTARHAVLLGLVVTITHTIGVFALGLVMLFAAQYIVPERLYPALSAVSGLTIAIMGAILLRQRWIGRFSDEAAIDTSNETHNSAYENVPLSDVVAVPKLRSGDLLSLQADKGPLSVKSLVALGITGGLLPCPSALVVMLSAVALHRVAFGLILIVAFSVGLAVVLTAIGVCVVYMRALTERIPTCGKLLQRLPVMSAAFVMLIGLFLIFKSLRGGGY